MKKAPNFSGALVLERVTHPVRCAGKMRSNLRHAYKGAYAAAGATGATGAGAGAATGAEGAEAASNA
jgi:hypothetical protein